MIKEKMVNVRLNRLAKLFDDEIDRTYGTTWIAGKECRASEILRKLHPERYSTGLRKYHGGFLTWHTFRPNVEYWHRELIRENTQ